MNILVVVCFRRILLSLQEESSMKKNKFNYLAGMISVLFVIPIMASADINLNSSIINMGDSVNQQSITNHNGLLRIYSMNPSGSALDVKYNFNGNNVAAIQGTSLGTMGQGYGGIFKGGWKGIEAYATSGGTGGGYSSRYAGYFQASGGTYSNHGVYSHASGSGTYSYGIAAIGSGSTYNYGIYASAYGGSANWAAYLVGDVVMTGTIYTPSDRKFKRDIAPIGRTLEKVMRLSPSSYTFKTDKHKNMNFPQSQQIGLIAQEVEEIFPDLVSTNAVPDPDADTDESGKPRVTEEYKAVNYLALIPILIKSIQEQQQEISELKMLVEANL